MQRLCNNQALTSWPLNSLTDIDCAVLCHAVAVSCSVNTRVGNELGAGNADGAKLAVFTAVVLVALVQSVLAVGCKLADKQVVGVLTNNNEVEQLTLLTLPVLLPTFVCECWVR